MSGTCQRHAWTVRDEQHSVTNHVCLVCAYCHAKRCMSTDAPSEAVAILRETVEVFDKWGPIAEHMDKIRRFLAAQEP